MPSLNLYDMISFKNICKERVLCRYNYSENREDHWLEPGRVYTYPRLVADLFMNNLVDHYINEHEGERGMNINNKVKRDEIWAMLLVKEQASNLPGVMTMEQMAIAEAKKINEAAKEPALPESAKAEEGDEPPVEQFAGLQAVDTTPKEKVTPTRDELLSFAVNKLKLTVDEKLIKIFTKTPEEIAEELQYHEHTAQ